MCVCMQHICSCVCIGACVLNAEARGWLLVFPSIALYLNFWDRHFSLNLELIILARLLGWASFQDPSVSAPHHRPWVPELWVDFKSWIQGMQTQVFLFAAGALPNKPPPWPLYNPYFLTSPCLFSFFLIMTHLVVKVLPSGEQSFCLSPPSAGVTGRHYYARVSLFIDLCVFGIVSVWDEREVLGAGNQT